MLLSGHIIKNLKAHHPLTQHQGPHSQQDDSPATSCRRVGGTHHPTSGDPLHYFKKASYREYRVILQKD